MNWNSQSATKAINTSGLIGLRIDTEINTIHTFESEINAKLLFLLVSFKVKTICCSRLT